jgi:hypothetical protein
MVYGTTKINGSKAIWNIGCSVRVSTERCLKVIFIIIYINDIGSAIKECEYYLFVDDTLLSVSGTSVQECMEKLNRDLENLSKWLKFNKLKLNVTKTKYIIMTGWRSNIENGSTSLIIGGEQIARVTTMKYLGVNEKLESGLPWNTTKTN